MSKSAHSTRGYDSEAKHLPSMHGAWRKHLELLPQMKKKSLNSHSVLWLLILHISAMVKGKNTGRCRGRVALPQCMLGKKKQWSSLQTFLWMKQRKLHTRAFFLTLANQRSSLCCFLHDVQCKIRQLTFSIFGYNLQNFSLKTLFVSLGLAHSVKGFKEMHTI